MGRKSLGGIALTTGRRREGPEHAKPRVARPGISVHVSMPGLVCAAEKTFDLPDLWPCQFAAPERLQAAPGGFPDIRTARRSGPVVCGPDTRT